MICLYFSNICFSLIYFVLIYEVPMSTTGKRKDYYISQEDKATLITFLVFAVLWYLMLPCLPGGLVLSTKHSELKGNHRPGLTPTIVKNRGQESQITACQKGSIDSSLSSIRCSPSGVILPLMIIALVSKGKIYMCGCGVCNSSNDHCISTISCNNSQASLSMHHMNKSIQELLSSENAKANAPNQVFVIHLSFLLVQI